jgi:hypothetical protein
LSEFRYEFSASLFAFFECTLRELLANPPADAQDKNPSDLVAHAVYRTAWMYGTPLPSFDRNRDELWPPGRPMSEAWLRLGKYPPPSGAELMIREELPDGTLRSASQESRHPLIAQRITYNADRTKLPKIVIEIEGEPVSILYRSRYVLFDPEQRVKVR